MKSKMGWKEVVPIILAVLLIAAFGFWYFYNTSRQAQPNNGFYSKQDTSPAATPEATSTKKNSEYTSRHGVVIKLDSRPAETSIASPYTLTGQVPGSWSFEASFPVELVDSNGSVLVKVPAHLTGDWMTTEYVPFTVTLSFMQAMQAQSGQLILRKDNPSGMAENDDEIAIPVQIATQS